MWLHSFSLHSSFLYLWSWWISPFSCCCSLFIYPPSTLRSGEFLWFYLFCPSFPLTLNQSIYFCLDCIFIRFKHSCCSLLSLVHIFSHSCLALFIQSLVLLALFIFLLEMNWWLLFFYGLFLCQPIKFQIRLFK